MAFNHNKPHSYQAGGRAMKSGLHMVKQGSVIVPPHVADTMFDGDKDTVTSIKASAPAGSGMNQPNDYLIQSNAKKIKGKPSQKMPKTPHSSAFFGSNS